MSEIIPNGFDYGSLEAPKQVRMNEIASEIASERVTLMNSMLNTGRLLIEAHSILSESAPKTFRPWLEEMHDITPRTAYRYMAAFEAFGNCEYISNLSDGAMIELSSESVPQTVTNKAISIAKEGKFVTRKLATMMIRRAKPKEEEAPATIPITPATPMPWDEDVIDEDQGDGDVDDEIDEPMYDEELEGDYTSHQDATGTELPDFLVDIFDEAAELEQSRRDLKDLMDWVEHYSGRPAGRIMARESNQLLVDLRNVDRSLKFATPYAICPYCKANRGKTASCKACQGAGWVGKDVYDQAPK